MVYLSLAVPYPNGRDAWFHILVARAWLRGENGMISRVVMEINQIPYAPIYHLLLTPFVSSLPLALNVQKVLQCVFYPGGLLAFMLLVKTFEDSETALTTGLLLAGTAYAFGMMQARPQSLSILLFPLLVYGLLREKKKTFFGSVAAIFYVHSPACLALVLGSLIVLVKKHKWKLIAVSTLIVLPILLFQAYFMVNAAVMNRWVARGDLGLYTDTVKFMSNPFFWTLNDLGFSVIGLALIPVYLRKFDKLSGFARLMLWSFFGFLIIFPVRYQGTFHYMVMPLAYLAAKKVREQNNLVKLVLLGIICFQVVLFMVYPVFWMSPPEYLETYW